MKSLQIITLGCSKNTVDTERLLGSLEGHYDIVPEEDLSRPVDMLLVNTCGFIGDAKEESRWELPPLYRSDMVPSKSKESDKAFVTKLLRTSYSCYDKYFPLVASSTDQWQEDRLFTTDTVLIIMGLGEAKAFPDMPVRVTINEYVEISKYYSTPKSRSFVNGILDRLIRQLMESGEIVKTGIFD